MQLCFDFDRVQVTPVIMPAKSGRLASPPVSERRRLRGQTAYHAGRLAEGAVADRYRRAGYQLVQARWRGKGGEIDLILRRGALYVFVEVKASKDFARAAERISRAQMNRICQAASEFCGGLSTGQQTEMRLDAALVDQFGRVEVIENAFGAE